jgi:DNA-binding beta-propeller fold protein YncE
MSVRRVAAAAVVLGLVAGAAALAWGVRVRGWRLLGLAGTEAPVTSPAPAARPGAASPVFSGHTAAVTSVAFSPDGTRALSGGGHGDGTVRVWELAPPRETTRFTGHGSSCSVLVVAFSGDAATAVSAAGPDDFSLRVWDVKTGAERQLLSGDVGLTFRAVSADGTRALGQESGADGRSRGFSIWNLATGARIAAIAAPDRASAIAFSPAGETVLTGGENGSLTLWNATTGERLRAFTGHGPQVVVRAVAVSRAGRLLVSAADDGTVVLWDPETGVPFRSIARASVFALADDGRTLAVAGEDSTIRVVDAISGEERLRLEGHEGGVTALAFAPGGRALVSGGEDRTVRIWTIESAAPAATVHTGRDDT